MKKPRKVVDTYTPTVSWTLARRGSEDKCMLIRSLRSGNYFSYSWAKGLIRSEKGVL